MVSDYKNYPQKYIVVPERLRKLSFLSRFIIRIINANNT